jgi:hypothetical protein
LPFVRIKNFAPEVSFWGVICVYQVFALLSDRNRLRPFANDDKEVHKKDHNDGPEGGDITHV